MPVTTTWNVWSPDDTAPVAPLEGLFQQQSTSVDLALTSVRRRASSTVANVTERNTLFPSPVQGNRVFRSDLGYEEGYFGLYNATSNPGGRSSVGWQRVESRVLVIPVSGATNQGTSDGFISVTHGMNRQPSSATATMKSNSNDLVSRVQDLILWDYPDLNTVRFRAIRRDDNSWFGSQRLNFDVVCIFS